MRRFPLYLALVLSIHLPGAYSQEAAANSGRVTLSNGRINVIAKNIPLRQLLEEIRQAAGFSLSTFPGAESEMISAVINDAPLEEALRIVLGRYDSVFLYSTGDSERAGLKSLWVYRKGQATGLVPAAAEALADTKGLRAKLNDSDPAVRARAFEAMLARPGIEEHDSIGRAVRAERDDGLRATMIESMRNSGLQFRPEFWGSLSADPSENVRMLVLDALEGTPQIRDFAALALTDPSPHVKQRAQEILEHLGAATASPKPGTVQ